MRFLRLLLSDAGPDRIRIIVTTIAAGLAMGAVLAVTNTVTDYQKQFSEQLTLIAIFIISCSVFLLSKSYALNTTTAVVEAMLDRIRTRFANKIRQARLTEFEALRGQIAVALPRDTQTLSEAGTTIIHGGSSAVMLIFSALYVASLSLYAFAITIALFGAAVYFYKQSQLRSADILREAIQSDTEFYSTFDHLLNGFKEIKLSTTRGSDLVENFLVRQSNRVHAYRVASAKRFNSGANVTNLFFYLLMGILVFGLPHNLKTSEVAAKVIFVIIFVGSSIEIVLRALPMLAKANFAIANLEELEKQLDSANERAVSVPDANGHTLSRSIECKAVSYSYFDHSGNATFRVGPVDLEIRAGETLFIVGGNGSGKSTILQLLARLYEPQTGTILWDGELVDQSNLAAYRSLFSAIFSDFHLFDRLYGQSNVDQGEVDALLERMELSHKTRYDDGRFSDLNLSTGQRKRLAMIGILLEDKPVWIFDEWAADQDPAFRRYFYEHLVPEWHDMGKTLIIVTHDDRYFSAADRIVVMEEGQIVKSDVSK